MKTVREILDEDCAAEKCSLKDLMVSQEVKKPKFDIPQARSFPYLRAVFFPGVKPRGLVLSQSSTDQAECGERSTQQYES